LLGHPVKLHPRRWPACGAGPRGGHMGPAYGAGVWGRHAGPASRGRSTGPVHGAGPRGQFCARQSAHKRLQRAKVGAKRAAGPGNRPMRPAGSARLAHSGPAGSVHLSSAGSPQLGRLTSARPAHLSTTGPARLDQIRWVRPAGPADGQLRPPRRSLQGPPTSGHPLGGAPAPCPARTQWGRRSGSRAWRCLRRPSGRGAL
jgi:hypothetical protein